MNSPFVINSQNLFLERFPVKQVNRSLQAWDAADEYLYNYLQQQDLNSPLNIVIFNDSFGALTCCLSKQHTLYCVNDSFLSQQGIIHNLNNNNITRHKLNLLTSLDDLPEPIDIILYKIPKNKGLVCHQLGKIKEKYNSEILFIAADRAKDIHRSTLQLFERFLGTTKTSLAVKKARLVFCKLDNKNPEKALFPITWPLEKTINTVNNSMTKHSSSQYYTISNHANVYSREKLDIGARYFMQNLPRITENAKVIDLGCGNGVIGLTVLSQQPNANVHFVDESYMAIASAQRNVADNLPQSLDFCQFHVNDCLTGFSSNSADLILCNPPFHQQTATTDHIAWQMFNDSYRVLKKGGELRIIGNRQLGYHIKLKRIFSNQKIIASNTKFVTISAIKH